MISKAILELNACVEAFQFARTNKQATMWRGSERFLIKDEMLPKSINPKWEDSEPIKVKLVRKNK